MARRKKGTGTIQYDKARNTYTARSADRSRSARFTTRKEAEAALAQWNKLVEDGINLKASRQTVCKSNARTRHEPKKERRRWAWH